MSLQDIASELAADFGLSLSNTTDRDLIVGQINKAAEEFYTVEKLKYAKREQLFTFGATDQQIVLPWNVQQVIHCRLPETLLDVKFTGFEPRYIRSAWRPPFVEFRVKEKTALKRELADVGPLTVTFASPVTANTSVTIVGKNDSSYHVKEVLSFLAGETAKSTLLSFSDVHSITKSITTTYDLTVTDLNGNEVADIPNNRLSVEYQLLDVLRADEVLSQDRIVELLYKIKLNKLIYDEDKFLGVEVYDNALYWKAYAFLAFKTSDTMTDKITAATLKADGLLSLADAEEEGQAENKIYMEPSPYFNMQPWRLPRRPYR